MTFSIIARSSGLTKDTGGSGSAPGASGVLTDLGMFVSTGEQRAKVLEFVDVAACVVVPHWSDVACWLARRSGLVQAGLLIISFQQGNQRLRSGTKKQNALATLTNPSAERKTSRAANIN